MNRIARPSRYHRRVGRALALLAPLTLAGCASYRTVFGDAVAPSTDVRIQFAPPRTLVVHSRNGDSTTVEEVIELRGKVVERSGDMITLEVSRVRTADSGALQRFGSGAVVRVPVQEFVEVREARTGRTVLLLSALLGVGLLIVAAIVSEPAPPPPKEPKEV